MDVKAVQTHRVKLQQRFGDEAHVEEESLSEAQRAVSVETDV